MERGLPGLGASLLVTLCALPCSAQLVFVDKAAESGTLDPSFGRGSAFADFDGDGLLDLVAGNAGMPIHFFRQLPDHRFEAANVLWGVADLDTETWGVLVADFDSDGDPDVIEVNGGFTLPEANRLLRNDLSTQGVFTDVSASSGDLRRVEKNFGGTAADYDRDGDLDVLLSRTDGPAILLRNDGALSFTDVSAKAGLTQGVFGRHVGQGDYDRDGLVDFFVADQRGSNLLYHNDGDGTFTEVAAAAGVDDPASNFGGVFADFDGDGWLDLYVAKYLANPKQKTSKFFLNQRDGTFRDVSASMGVTGQRDMGHEVADLDSDGYPDVFIGTGSPELAVPDVLWRIFPDGSGGLSFEDVSDSSGITSVGGTRCHGMAVADYDGDGFVDVFTNYGGPSRDPGTLEGSALWKNLGNANGWLGLVLRGVVSNRDAVGAHAVARTAGGRAVHLDRAIGTGFCNSKDPVLHFGLGAEQSAESVEIHWPSGIVQLHYAPDARAVRTVVETGLQLEGAPQLGTDVVLHVAGPALHETLVFVSDSLTWVPLPRLHAVWQLGSPFRLLVRRTTDSDGLASATLHVPSDPALLGVALHLQAWMAADRSVTLSDPLTVVVE